MFRNKFANSKTFITFVSQSAHFMNTHTAYGKVLPSFAHTSPDGSKNQPIRKGELDGFNDGKPYALNTNPKPNRKARRDNAKLRAKRIK